MKTLMTAQQAGALGGLKGSKTAHTTLDRDLGILRDHENGETYTSLAERHGLCRDRIVQICRSIRMRRRLGWW